MPGPIEGLRVVDFGQLIAGPLAATLLADFGADVVKVESPTGDPCRQMGPSKEGVPLWWKVNGRNKRTITLDLKQPDDFAVFRRLVEKADVVTENLAPGTATRLGLGYEAMKEWNPGIIYLSVSGWGQTGPRRDLRGFGRTAEAFSGMAYTTGYPGQPPIHMAFPVADCASGVFGAMAVMMAVYERARNPNGEGQHIDVALYESIFRLMELPPIMFDQLGLVLERMGAKSSYVAPVNTWETKDGKWGSFTGSTQPIVERLFTAMGRPELIDDPRFRDNASRLANDAELDEIVADWMHEHTLAEVLEIFDRHDVAIAPVLSIEQIFDEKHYWERDMLLTVEDPELGATTVPGVVPKLSRTPGSVDWLGHPMDADREAVLRDWLGEPS